MARMREAAGQGGTEAAETQSKSGQTGGESSLAQPGRGGQDRVSAVGIPEISSASSSCWMPRANNARGKVRGALPRSPARGTPPETPSPLSLALQIPERSSPSRVRFAAQNRRALDCSGPFRTTHLDKGKGANAKATPGSSAVTKGDISIEALRGTFLSRLDTDRLPHLHLAELAG